MKNSKFLIFAVIFIIALCFTSTGFAATAGIKVKDIQIAAVSKALSSQKMMAKGGGEKFDVILKYRPTATRMINSVQAMQNGSTKRAGPEEECFCPNPLMPHLNC